jgi:WD40 repeat protein
LEAATGREVRPTGGHRADVGSVAFAAGGKSLATWGQDQTFRLWDAVTGRETRRLGGWAVWGDDGSWVYRGVLSPDGRTLATAHEDKTIRLWDLRTGKAVRKLQGHRGSVWHITFSADGKTLASAAHDRTVRVWDVDTGKLLRRLKPTPSRGASPPAFSPDGKTVAFATGVPQPGAAGPREGYSVGLWDVATGRELQRFDGPRGEVSELAFSSDGRTLAGASWGETTVWLWDVATGKERRRFDWQPALKEPQGYAGHQDGVTSLAFSPDDRTLAASCSDQAVRLWGVASGRERRRFVGHAGSVFSVAFAPDGRRLASGASDTTVLVWDVTGLGDGEGLRAVDLPPQEVEGLWADLGGDAGGAGRAVWKLAAAPRQAVPLLRRKLRPAAADEARVTRLIADLDSDRFPVREQAAQELEQIGDIAEPALRKALASPPSAEVRRRAGQLLEKLGGPVTAPGALRELRAVEVLEHIGTPAAREVLESLARGAPGARLTREARASLERLARRPAP